MCHVYVCSHIITESIKHLFFDITFGIYVCLTYYLNNVLKKIYIDRLFYLLDVQKDILCYSSCCPSVCLQFCACPFITVCMWEHCLCQKDFADHKFWHSWFKVKVWVGSDVLSFWCLLLPIALLVYTYVVSCNQSPMTCDTSFLFHISGSIKHTVSDTADGQDLKQKYG